MNCRALTAALLALAFDAGAATPTLAQVRAAHRASESVLLDRHGAPIESLRTDMTASRGNWVALADISPAVQQAVIQAEDQRFMEHGGVDVKAIGQAAWDNLFRARPRGASTLTMQLAAQLDTTLRPGQGGRSLGQKWDQAMAARELDAAWSKGQVMEAYLNLVPFRGELRGIGAASARLFGKAPSGLGATEAVILASLVRAPSAAPAVVARRACALAASLKLAESCAGITWEVDKALSRPAAVEAHGGAGPVARLLLKPGSGAVRSTLDAPLQRFAQQALRRRLAELGGRNVGDGALVVLDNASGEVLAYVANAGDTEVDGVAALRQAGSTLKPFLYGLAIERGLLTAASVLDDSPLGIGTESGFYVPRNYEKDFKGYVSLRTSLASSLNVPAVRTLMLTGVDRFHARLRELGLRSLVEPAAYYGPSLALGSAEVSLLDLANAYRTLANGGLHGAPTLAKRAPGTPQRVFDARAAFIVGDILADPAARAPTFGLRNELAATYWAAVKTGTSKDMRDNWAVGWSSRFTVGVWVGNFDGRPMWDVSGVTGAAPAWRDVMDYLHQGAPGRAPAAPAGVVRAAVKYEPAIEAPRREWFVAGSESTVITVLSRPDQAPRIVYPPPLSILALDPDIPAERERVMFRAQAGQGLEWELDGKVLGPASAEWSWKPTAGAHVLRLLEPGGRERASSAFSVRGE
ncbi:MAG: penicillin-binding protein 1C [Telluria sp.]